MQPHRLRTLAALLAAVLLLFSLSALTGCGRQVPDGAYSLIWADTGEIYTFSGREVRVTLFIMGNATENHVGTYRISGGEITFDFPTDADGVFSGTFPFAYAEDGSSVTISGVEYVREVLPAVTTKAE